MWKTIHRVSIGIRCSLIVFLCLFSNIAWADYVEVRRNANIYTDPVSSSPVLEYIDADASDQSIYLQIESSIFSNGYHHVRLRGSTQAGWIYKTRVRKYKGNSPGSNNTVQVEVYGGYPDDSSVGDYITDHTNTGYVVGYSETKWNPLWVAYHISADDRFDCPRLTRFKTDRRTEARVTHDNYNNTGYDRGHMAPSHNIGSRYGCAAQNETYFTSNITPQIPLLNQRSWGGLEKIVSGKYATEFNEVWVITGPIFDPVWMNQLCSGVEIPVAFYKIIIREIDGKPDILAVIFDQGSQPQVKLSTLVTTIDEIERRTNIDFLSDLTNELENSIESIKATDNDWLLETKLDTNFRPTVRSFCTLDRIRRSEYDYDQ